MWHKFAQKWRTLGAADTAWFVLDTLLSRLSGDRAHFVKYYLVAQPVAPAEPAGASGAVRLYLATQVDDVMRQAPRPEATLQGRFAQSSACIVAERSGELAGFVWWCPQPYREDTVRCDYHWTPTASARWDYDVYVAPPFRMGRLFARLWQQTHAQLAAEGVRWTLSRIDAFNADSLAAHRRLGAREIGCAWFVVLGPWQLMASTASPRLHLSVRTSQIPQLRIDISTLDAPTPRP